MKSVRPYQVDAFTPRPFAGNRGPEATPSHGRRPSHVEKPPHAPKRGVLAGLLIAGRLPVLILARVLS